MQYSIAFYNLNDIARFPSELFLHPGGSYVTRISVQYETKFYVGHCPKVDVSRKFMG